MSLIPALLFAMEGATTAQPKPVAPAVSTTAAPKAYVALHDNSALAIFDTGTNRVLRTIPVPLGPQGLAVTPDGHKVYVSSDETSIVSVIDTAADRVVTQIDVGAASRGLAISPDGRMVLVSVWGADEVAIIDTATDRITGRVSVLRPDRIAISPDGGIAYVGSTSLGDPALAILDLTGPAKIDRVPLSHVPGALAFSVDGRRLYFTVDGMDTLQVLDRGRNKVVRTVAAGAAPHGLVSVAGRYGELVTSASRNELEILDASLAIVRGTVTVGRLPHGIATSANERTAYVTNNGSNDISVVDLADRRVTATISLGDAGYSPGEIVLQPATIREPSQIAPDQFVNEHETDRN